MMLTFRGTKAGIHNIGASWIVSTVCGKPAVTGKIFGGQNAQDCRWPWQASLFYRGKHICGAALIDAYWVISAAHCFQKCVFSMGPVTWLGLGREHKWTEQKGDNVSQPFFPRFCSWLPLGVCVHCCPCL